MFKVFDKEMNPINFPDGIEPLDIFISSIEKVRSSGRSEGSNKKINHGYYYNDRDIELKIWMRAQDTQDYRLLRNALYEMFQMNDEMYVSETYESGKRYLVSVEQRFTPSRIPNNQKHAEATIMCSKLDLPFAESVGTTQTIQQNGINSEDELWSFGMGLIDDDELQYTHESNRFSIYNAGNVPVHPFEQDLKIIINNIQASSVFFELQNITNGSKFRAEIGVPSGHEIVIDGPKVTRNSLSFLRDTTKEFIELSPGWNEFEITGASSAKVEFDFRFYYK